jgi:hypothetical protein
VTDQEFMESPLSSDVMTIGTQDAVLLLSETVGYFDAQVLKRLERYSIMRSSNIRNRSGIEISKRLNNPF